jgi:enoyl-CoA hydratase
MGVRHAMSDKLRLERHDDGVRVLTLNDPEKRNAIGAELRAALLADVAGVADDPDARVLVVTGEGSAFCAGADLPTVFGDVDAPVGELRDQLQSYYRSFLGILDLAIPTIAAVQGPAIGAGLNLALVCDLCIVGPAGRLGATFSRIGLHPGGGCTYFLTRAVGRQRALSILLEGQTLDAQTAVAYGLALELVDDPLARALEIAHVLAGRDPGTLKDIKRAVALAESDGYDATAEYEAWAQAASAKKPAIQETVNRFRAAEP